MRLKVYVISRGLSIYVQGMKLPAVVFKAVGGSSVKTEGFERGFVEIFASKVFLAGGARRRVLLETTAVRIKTTSGEEVVMILVSTNHSKRSYDSRLSAHE
ncbi:unnamed protein product [Cochlearia groenlandica]